MNNAYCYAGGNEIEVRNLTDDPRVIRCHGCGRELKPRTAPQKFGPALHLIPAHKHPASKRK
jgi:hypothetical protein